MTEKAEHYKAEKFIITYKNWQRKFNALKHGNRKKINFIAIRLLFFKRFKTRLLLVKKNYKYYIGYLNNDHKVKPVHIMLPSACADVKSYDRQTKWMYFLIEGDGLVEKCNTTLG